MKSARFSKIFSALSIAALGFALLLISNQPATAAIATPAYDQLNNNAIGVPANHEIVFKTPTGVDQPSDTVVISLPNFVFGALTISDIDLHYGLVTGYENATATAAAPGVDTWGVAIAGNAITFTAPTNAALGTVPANNKIAIRIGLNAGGINQLTNPGSAMSASVTIGGTFGDANTIVVPILGSGSLSVSAFITTTSTPPTPPSGGGGGGGGGTISAPVISNIQAINITSSTARITWDTDKLSNSSVSFGFTVAHASGTVSDATLKTSHSIDLSGLSPNTMYHFVVTSVDSTFLSTSSGDQTFITQTDVTPPVISNIHVVNITNTSGIVMWDTDEPANSFVQYGTTVAYGSSESSAGYLTNHSIQLNGLSPGTLYHFRVASTDIAGNGATSTDDNFTTTIDVTPPSNVTLTATPGDSLVHLDWTLPPDPDFLGTRIMRKTGGFPIGPTDGILVYDGSATSTNDIGLLNGTTYYYGAYAYDTLHNYASGALATAIPVGPPPPPLPPAPTSTPPIPPTPTSTPPVPPSSTTTPPLPPAPGATTTLPVVPPAIPTSTTTTPSATTTPPTVPPTTIVPGAVQISAQFFNANKTIEFVPDTGGRVGVLNSTTVFVSLPTATFTKVPTLATLTVGNSIYALALSADGLSYTTTFVAPVPGEYPSIATVNFSDGTVGQASYTVNSQYGGKVVEEGSTGPTNLIVPDAAVQIYRDEQGTWTKYGTALTTGTDGSYAAVLPNGRYYSEISKEGYRTKKSDTVEVRQNVYNETLALIRIPKPQQVAEGAPFTAALAITAANISEQLVYGMKIAREISQTPEIQQANAIAAPTLLTVAVLNSASAISFFNLLAYLQYLFTQPLLLFGRRKKKKWGIIFNSLSKQPIDLAIVRLIHFETKLVMQTVVTDKFGRYRFLAQKGNYMIEVVKPGYVFPTSYLGDKKEDVDYLDLYHGEKMEIAEDGVISSNIPLDPLTSEETPRRVLLRKTMMTLRHSLAFSGIPFGIIILTVTPSAPNGLLLLAQIGVYVLFRRLSMPAKARSWGSVFDAKTKQPIRSVVVRIFDKKFNKLLETQVTDRNGKYGFFVRRNIYYITADKAGYKKFTSPDIDLSQKDEAVIDQNVSMERVEG